jgi:predicted anti-sigma-YlaC factor YlaD
MRRRALFATATLWLATSTACSGLAAKVAANALTSGGETYASDGDPELVRDAVPFGLKTMESVLAADPRNEKLLLALCSGYTQYAYAFVVADADAADLDGKLAESKALRARAKRLFLRARDYGLRALDEQRDGMGRRLKTLRDLSAVLAAAKKEDVPALYWTGSAWTLAIVSAKADLGLVAELPAPVAMLERALALDEAWDGGSIHEYFVAYDASRTEKEGGGPARVRGHYQRALELSMNQKLGPRVSLAEGLLVQTQDRAGFTDLLEEVLRADVDAAPRYRLVNTLAQRRARLLLDHADDLFL